MRAGGREGEVTAKRGEAQEKDARNVPSPSPTREILLPPIQILRDIARRSAMDVDNTGRFLVLVTWALHSRCQLWIILV